MAARNEIAVVRRRDFDLGPQKLHEKSSAATSRRGITRRPSLTRDDMRIHAWLIARQALVGRERSGWGAKLRQFFQF